MKKYAGERKMRVSGFFVFSYSLVALMILLQLALMGWLEFVS